jgi:hypothetical protein
VYQWRFTGKKQVASGTAMVASGAPGSHITQDALPAVLDREEAEPTASHAIKHTLYRLPAMEPSAALVRSARGHYARRSSASARPTPMRRRHAGRSH